MLHLGMMEPGMKEHLWNDLLFYSVFQTSLIEPAKQKDNTDYFGALVD